MVALIQELTLVLNAFFVSLAMFAIKRYFDDRDGR